MKFADYSKVQALGEENIFLLDGPNGTKTILASDLAKAIVGLLTSKEFISGVNMADLDQAASVVNTNKLLVSTAAGNQAVNANVLAKALVGMLTSSELVSGLKLSDLTKATTLASGDYVMAGLTAGNRAMTAKNLSTSLLALLTSQEFISGLKMGDLTQATALTASDNILVGTTAGNKYMKASDAMFAMLDAFASRELHRMIFRGKNLGTSFTSARKAEVTAGTFKDLYLGDYWVINSVTWRIVDFDYWYGQGDTSFTKHHLVIMPDSRLYTAKMNDTNTTEGGYVGSKMYTENLEQAKTTIQTAFGSALLTHRERLVNAVTNGKPSGGGWFDSTVELPNEIMMYGTSVFTPANDGTTVSYLYTIDQKQLALMQAVPRFINPSRQDNWLRDVVSSAAFAYVSGVGDAVCSAASSTRGVRPVFPVG